MVAAIEISFACCVWLRVDWKYCGCGLSGAVEMVAGAAFFVLCWLREGLCLTLVAADMARLLFFLFWNLEHDLAICRVWSFWWLGARMSMLKPSECC